MALLNQPVQVYAQLKTLFDTLRQGQAPEKFTREFLKDMGFTSSNHLAFIPLLKGLGFLSADGAPTQRYRTFLDRTLSSKTIAEAVKEAYGDIFVLKARPTKADKALIEGKYKTAYNLSDLQADRAARTFLALLDISDPQTLYMAQPEKVPPDIPKEVARVDEHPAPSYPERSDRPTSGGLSLHYNIQIHLPPTKDIEVYNAIFRAIREHLVE